MARRLDGCRVTILATDGFGQSEVITEGPRPGQAYSGGCTREENS